MNKISKTLLALGALGALGVVVLAVYFFSDSKSFEDLKQSVAPTASLYPKAKTVSGVLNFVDDNANPVHLAELTKNKWVLLYFGYTSCPDACPIDLSKISQTLYKMDNADKLQVVFVSVDPARDTGKLSSFAKGFNSKFIGLSASNDNLITISKTLGIYHQVVKTQELASQHKNTSSNDDHSMDSHDDHYLVDHTTSYLLLNPELGLSAILSNPHEPNAMAKALDAIITTLR